MPAPIPESQLSEFFWKRVDRSGGPDACWPWQLTATRDGYGVFQNRHYRGTAHAFAHQDATGAIPVNPRTGRKFPVDHKCHNRDVACPGGPCQHRRCCNPRHLRVATDLENIDAAKQPRKLGKFAEQCSQGHDFNEVNTGWERKRGYSFRYCKACLRERGWKRRHGSDRPGDAETSLWNRNPAVCSRGHDYTITEKFVSTTGKRYCGACREEDGRKRRKSRG
jgi:hypothetical protein